MSETDDLVSRARRHAETHPESRELIEELLEELLEAVVRWACFAAPPPVPSWPDGVLRDAANRLRWIANSGYIEDPGIKRIIRSWADELDATPVPPWPGDENDDTARLSPDQGDRIVNACCRMLGCEPADIDGDAALEEILTEAVERCADLHGQDRWEDDCHGCGFRVGDHTTDGRCPAPATPVPPWPGAVLSGLVDEDGVPTWLAQAGQVRGEQVRRRSDLVWVNNDQMVAFSDTVWVEVRDPRAVPEPETERVPWWAAVGRWTTGDELIVEVARTSVVPVVTVEGGGRVRVAPDGTVEVLRQDGDR